MPAEPLHNIVPIPPGRHRPDPGAIFSTMPVGSFFGKHVKLAVPFGCGKHIEHMWFLVLGPAEHEDEELRGQLDNTPLYAEMKEGDLVEFKRNEIETVLTED